MLGRFRSALYSAIGPLEEDGLGPETIQGARHGTLQTKPNKQKYSYQRPSFLKLATEDEIQVTADHLVRPIIVPRDVSVLPWAAGYAETINAGKSRHNEDQAMARQGVVCVVVGGQQCKIPYTMFSVYDGHAGAATAVTASNDLWQAVQARLESVGAQLLTARQAGQPDPEAANESATWFPTKSISEESLVIGALEAAFWETDQQIGEEKKVYWMPGGCTVLVALFILGKLYVANAGDSRAVLTRSSRAYPMSYDFTPVSERQRLQTLGRQAPHLLGQEYTWLEYVRRPTRRDIGSRMLYRDAHMTGWAYKIIQESDLKFPMVYGEGKRSRLLATIGVTRGFGDHDLRAQSQNGTVLIKPFLSPQPEVRVLDVETEAVTVEDVLVLGTDGLWDVVSNEEVAAIVQRGLQAWDNESKAGKYRYISLAQDLVMAARGKMKDRNWKRSQGGPATIDDISVFVIPILPYKQEMASARARLEAQEEGREAMEIEGEEDKDKGASCDSSSPAQSYLHSQDADPQNNDTSQPQSEVGDPSQGSQGSPDQWTDPNRRLQASPDQWESLNGGSPEPLEQTPGPPSQ